MSGRMVNPAPNTERGQCARVKIEGRFTLKEKRESAFSGEQRDNFPKETHDILDSGNRTRSETRRTIVFSPDTIRRQNRLTARDKTLTGIRQ